MRLGPARRSSSSRARPAGETISTTARSPLSSITVRSVGSSTPSELPIERPTQFELILNARTAERFNINFSAELLAQADEVLE